MYFIKKLILSLVLPPAGPVLLAITGVVVSRYRPLLGKILAGISLAGLIALSTPSGAGFLLNSLQPPPINRNQLASCQAIVVLGGGIYRNSPEYGSDTVGDVSLERLRYALYLSKLSGLPILASGGAPGGGIPEAVAMRNSAEDDFGSQIQWIETQSMDTSSSARLSATILKEQGVKRIALVSHAWHLPRATIKFESEGLIVAPAPMGVSRSRSDTLQAFLPSASALSASSRALHEWIGIFAGHLGAIWTKSKIQAT